MAATDPTADEWMGEGPKPTTCEGITVTVHLRRYVRGDGVVLVEGEVREGYPDSDALLVCSGHDLATVQERCIEEMVDYLREWAWEDAG